MWKKVQSLSVRHCHPPRLPDLFGFTSEALSSQETADTSSISLKTDTAKSWTCIWVGSSCTVSRCHWPLLCVRGVLAKSPLSQQCLGNGTWEHFSHASGQLPVLPLPHKTHTKRQNFSGVSEKSKCILTNVCGGEILDRRGDGIRKHCSWLWNVHKEAPKTPRKPKQTKTTKQTKLYFSPLNVWP